MPRRPPMERGAAEAAAKEGEAFWLAEIRARQRGAAPTLPNGATPHARPPTLREALEPRMWRARWMLFQRPLLHLKLLNRYLGRPDVSDRRLRFHWRCRMLPNKIMWPATTKRRFLRHFDANREEVMRNYVRNRRYHERCMYREHKARLARGGGRRKWPTRFRPLNRSQYFAYLYLNPDVNPETAHCPDVQREMRALKKAGGIPVREKILEVDARMRAINRAALAAMGRRDPCCDAAELPHRRQPKARRASGDGATARRPPRAKAHLRLVLPATAGKKAAPSKAVTVAAAAAAAHKAKRRQSKAANAASSGGWAQQLQTLLMQSVDGVASAAPLVRQLVADPSVVKAAFPTTLLLPQPPQEQPPLDAATVAAGLLTRTRALIAAVEQGRREEAAAASVDVAQFAARSDCAALFRDA